MSITRLKVENVSKQYRLGQVGTGTLVHDLNRFWYKIRGKEDPYKLIGNENDRETDLESDYVWALQDINLEIKDGDILGVIGKNGAGKSTLLKLLSKITTPTNGEIKINGRIASLLEVGTGMHPELTGKENIYLNGAILGMTKKEIDANFDEIVNFAGIKAYIETPFKRYSSGMGVRLGFAVAAFLDPEILIVDEVLAVGDAEFQKRAIGKMKEISSENGRTVLFVSHNMLSIEALCNKAILMENGKIKAQGETKDIIQQYLSDGQQSKFISSWDKGIHQPGNNNVKLVCVELLNARESEFFDIQDELKFRINYKVLGDDLRAYNLSISLFNEKETYVLASPSYTDKKWFNKPHPLGKYTSDFSIPANLLNTGKFSISVLLIEAGSRVICQIDEAIVFELLDQNRRTSNFFGNWSGIIRPELNWNTTRND